MDFLGVLEKIRGSPTWTDSGMEPDNENSYEIIDRDKTYSTLLRAVQKEDENNERHRKNAEEHERLKELYDLAKG